MIDSIEQPSSDPLFGQVRLVMYHKQATSARTRFLRLPSVGVCAFGGLPQLSSVVERKALAQRKEVRPHPAAMVTWAERLLSLPSGSLEVEGEFAELVDVPEGPLWIFLARFTSIDPPFEQAEAVSGRFVDLTQSRDLPAPQLELLRRVYCHVMGG